jgi:hypothetical protein
MANNIYIVPPQKKHHTYKDDHRKKKARRKINKVIHSKRCNSTITRVPPTPHPNLTLPDPTQVGLHLLLIKRVETTRIFT